MKIFIVLLLLLLLVVSSFGSWDALCGIHEGCRCPACRAAGEEGGFSLWNPSGYSTEGTVRKQGFDISLSLSYLEVLIAVMGFTSWAWLLVRPPCQWV